MKYIVYALWAVFILQGCGTTTDLIGSWSNPEVQPKKYEKLAVVLFSPKRSNRAIIEMDMALKFRENGIKATATYIMFPLVGKMDEIKAGMPELSEEEFQEQVKQKVKKNKIDAIMLITLLDVQKEKRYVPASGVTVAGNYFYDPNNPTSRPGDHPEYGYHYYQYYHYAHQTIGSPGYYENVNTYFVESNLYDVASGELLWSGQSKTKDPSSIEKESKKFAEMVVNEVLAKNVLVR